MTSPAIVEKLQNAVRHHQAGDIQQASCLYREVLAADPQNADAWHLQGLVDFASGNQTGGESGIRHAIELNPTAVEFRANLAAVLVKQHQPVEAEELCREILRNDSSHHGALTHLGTALRQQRRLGEARETFGRAAEIKRDASSLCNIATVLTDLGEVDHAHRLLLEARQLGPHYAQIHINLSVVLRKKGDVAGALESLDTARKLAPSSDEVHTNRGNLFVENGMPIEAVEEYQQAISLNPYAAPAVSGLGRTLEQLGAWDEALEAHRLAARLEPHNNSYSSSCLYASSLSPVLSRNEVVEEHLIWGRQLEQAVSMCRQPTTPAKDRPLRIGYVSPDFRSHATMRFFYPLLKSHDRDSFRIFLYSETAQEDRTTEHARELADGWCRTRPLSDAAMAAQIQNDRIDILVDLAGHTEGNRLPVFARKPAPIQAVFLGYPTTTGLTRIDYFLTDAIREPGNPSSFFSEKPVSLPHGACCFEAPDAPPVSDPPCRQNGHVTFGSTHRLEKISSQALLTWARVLDAVPDSRLLLFRDVLKSESLRVQMQAAVRKAGIDLSRVDFGWQLPDPHLQLYAQIDILLDVFPWGSGTIAYDAMWMGVPIPTIAGERGACRATASMMHHSGFPELIAESDSHYVEIVQSLAAAPDRLSDLRHQTRAKMKTSVCDSTQFARDIENAYRTFRDTHIRDTSCRQDGI